MDISRFVTYDVTFVLETDTVERALKIMKLSNLTTLPIVDNEMKVLGIIKESDIIKASMPSYFSLLKSASLVPDMGQLQENLTRISKDPVSKYAQRNPYVVKPTDSLMHVADRVIRENIRFVPVVDNNGVLIGMITRLGLLVAIAECNRCK